MSTPAKQTRRARISAEARAEIDRWIAKYPPEWKRAAVIAALHTVQEENNGWLTNDLIEAVADYLGMPPVAVEEVATFYSLFDLAPTGRHKIYVCTNISCMLCGSDQIVAYLQKKLAVTLGGTSKDGKFTLREVECLAACGGAPMMQVDKEYHEHLTPAKIDDILARLD